MKWTDPCRGKQVGTPLGPHSVVVSGLPGPQGSVPPTTHLPTPVPPAAPSPPPTSPIMALLPAMPRSRAICSSGPLITDRLKPNARLPMHATATANRTGPSGAAPPGVKLPEADGGATGLAEASSVPPAPLGVLALKRAMMAERLRWLGWLRNWGWSLEVMWVSGWKGSGTGRRDDGARPREWV